MEKITLKRLKIVRSSDPRVCLQVIWRLTKQILYSVPGDCNLQSFAKHVWNLLGFPENLDLK